MAKDKPTPDPNALTFSLVLATQPVTLQDAEGVDHNYVLKECTGTNRDTYLNDLARRMGGEIKEGVGIRNFDGFKAKLISMCLWAVDNDGNETPVSLATIAAWPGKVQDALFERAQTLSGLDDDAEEGAAKN